MPSAAHFNADLIGRIQARVEQDPGVSRGQLSREICEWMGWRSTSGRLQEMGCRKILAKLNRQGVLRLPARERICQVDETWAAELPEVDIPELSCRLEELGEVTVEPVGSRQSKKAKVVRVLLQRHHYLGAGTMRGNQIRYVIRSER